MSVQRSWVYFTATLQERVNLYELGDLTDSSYDDQEYVCMLPAFEG